MSLSPTIIITAPKQDYCTMVPDAPFGFDFSQPCMGHDQNYSADSTVSRATADQIFRDAMYQSCDANYGGSLLCYATATVYYLGVRSFGWLFYDAQPGG